MSCDLTSLGKFSFACVYEEIIKAAGRDWRTANHSIRWIVFADAERSFGITRAKKRVWVAITIRLRDHLGLVLSQFRRSIQWAMRPICSSGGRYSWHSIHAIPDRVACETLFVNHRNAATSRAIWTSSSDGIIQTSTGALSAESRAGAFGVAA